MRKNVIIVGMARSGTSLTASIFARKGYFGGDDFRPADHFNPTGYWESGSLVERNAKLIKSTGFPHDNGWIYGPISDAQIQQLQSTPLSEEEHAFVAQFEQHEPWLWKDPRLCFTLRAWWPLLDPAKTAVLLIERDHDAIFNSFVRAGWRTPDRKSREETYARIRSHIDCARRTIEELQIPALVMNYAEFATDPEGVARRINECFGLDLVATDLGYDDELNHDSVKGRLATVLDRVATMMPATLRRMIKRLTPLSVMKVLYPERFR